MQLLQPLGTSPEGSWQGALQLAVGSACTRLSALIVQVDLPVGPEIVLLDIAFTPADPNHGRLPPLSICSHARIHKPQGQVLTALWAARTSCEPGAVHISCPFQALSKLQPSDRKLKWQLDRPCAAAALARLRTLRSQDGCGQALAVILFHIQGGRSWACAGFLLGSRQTLLETKDGGKSWTKRDISAAKEEGFNFRFTSISFQVGPTPSAAGMQGPLASCRPAAPSPAVGNNPSMSLYLQNTVEIW